VCRVAAGAIAKKILGQIGVRIIGYVKQLGEVCAEVAGPSLATLEQVEARPGRCPDPERASQHPYSL
jgi:chorismate synthase